MAKKAVKHGKAIVFEEKYSSLAEMLIYIAQKYPRKGITYINVYGEENFISYQELVDSAVRYLESLYQKGVKPGDILILEIDNAKVFYSALWACFFGGIIAAPVSQPTSWKPKSQGLSKLIHIWKTLKKPVILTRKRNAKFYQSLQEDSQYKDLCFISADELNSSKKAKIHQRASDDLVFLQFSSGSTGNPKGVKLSNKNILTNISSISNRINSTNEDVVFTWLPHTHDMGLFFQHLVPIFNGSNIMKFSPHTFIRSPYIFLKKITEHKGSWFASPNFGFAWMTEKVSDAKLSNLDLSSLRFILNGAEPISVEVIKKFAEKFSKCGYKENMMLPGYGMAEATVAVTISEVKALPKIAKVCRSKLINENRAVAVEENDKSEFVNEGQVINGMSVRIVDNKGSILEENMVGEIQIKGESVTSGYYNRRDLTEKMFSDGWLHTGDLGFMVDGSLVVTGRKKDIIFLHGQNYFAHDLEEIIYKKGEFQRGNIALVGNFNTKTQKEELLVFIKYKYSIEKFMPVRQNIIDILKEALGIDVTHVLPIRSIPKTTSGKLKRYQLRKCYENGNYNDLLKEIAEYIKDNQEETRDIRLPQNDLEIFLHKSWSKILEIPETEISIDDLFFSLGGDSIKAYQLLGEMEKHLNREIDSEVLILCKTIREIAEYLQTKPSVSFETASTLEANNELDINKAVAITGISFRLPGAQTQKEFWDNLSSKKDLISKVSAERKELSGMSDWEDWLGELKNIDCFDNDFFDIPPEEAVFMDPQQRLVLESSYEALEDAGIIPDLEIEHNIGVYAGISENTYKQLLIEYINENGTDKLHKNAMVRNLHNIVAASLSHIYNFTGPALAVDTACSSFMVALHHAVLALRNNSIFGAVVAGANILTTPTIHKLTNNAGILSSTKYTKVFDRDADGSVLGEGVVVIYIEPLLKAVKEKKNIYAVIRGTAVNNDGNSLGIMAPNPKSQYKVLLEAYRDANLSPDEISYIEAHGTGTTIGDPIELNALSRLFSDYKSGNDSKIGIGSVKSNIGHLLNTAGGAGLIKVLLCMKYKKLVPSLHIENLNPALQLEKTPFYVVKDVMNWETSDNNSRKAGLSSFGLGGTNAHVILEEWNKRSLLPHQQKTHLLTFSAKSEKALESIINQTAEIIKDNPQLDINNLCFTRNRCRKHYRYRAACPVDTEQNQAVLASVIKGQSLKNKSAQVLLMIGDFKNSNPKKNLSFRKNSVFQKEYLEIKDGAVKQNIIRDTREDNKELMNFSYWYLMIKTLKIYGTNIVKTVGIKSGQILADLFNEKIDLTHALEIYFSSRKTVKRENIDVDQLSQFKVDIVLSLSKPQRGFYDMLLKKRKRKFKIISLELDTENLFERNLLSVMGRLYVLGADFNWKEIYPDGSGRLIHLPSYPFKKKSFWIN